MIGKKYIRPLCSCIVFGLTLLVCNSLTAAEAEKAATWDEAGQKVMEAGRAVGDATGETKDRVVEEAMQAWEDAKEQYQESVAAAKKKYDEEVEKARAKIHAATAPKESGTPDSSQEVTGAEQNRHQEQEKSPAKE